MSLAQLLGFGKKRRSPAKKAPAGRPSEALRRMCKKYGIKLTIKRGGKRVYKSEKVLKAACKKAAAAHKKKAPVKRRRTRRFASSCASHGFGKRGKSYFGDDDEEDDEEGMEFGGDDGHGSMFGSVVSGPESAFGKRRRATKAEMVARRRSRSHSAFGMSPGFVGGPVGRNGCYPQYSPSVSPSLGIHGTGKPFFLSTVPGPYPPEWARHAQPDGSYVAWGSPHLAYKAPSNGLSFGKKRRAPARKAPARKAPARKTPSRRRSRYE